MRHGAPSTYRHGCRCADCRAYNANYQRELVAYRKAHKIEPSIHGVSGYSNYGCRCEICRIEWARRTREARARRVIQAKTDPTYVPHGTANGYQNYGCRCEDCRLARRATQQAYTARRRAARQAGGS